MELLNMATYQSNLVSANKSIENRSNYDKRLTEVYVMEDNMLSILDLMNDNNVMGKNHMSKFEAE